MENEQNKNFIQSNEELSDIFKIDYGTQNLEKNILYQKWSQLMLRKYGKDAKLFRCINDNILFYSTYYKCLRRPSFKMECPICKKEICHFCSNNKKEKWSWIQCCMKRAINKAIFYYGQRYTKNIDNNNYLSPINKILFIPGLNLLILIIKIIDLLYLDLSTKESLKDNKDLFSFGERLEDGYCFFIFIGLMFAFGILLSIIFFIYNTFFLIILLVISIPCKVYPLKYYYGIISSYI